jgi:NADH-quinone oxidoreductase subunit G
MIKAVINGIPFEVEYGTTILEAAKQVLCKDPHVMRSPGPAANGACGICVVRVKGSNRLLRACCTPLNTGWI